jgi:hypothetical protein
VPRWPWRRPADASDLDAPVSAADAAEVARRLDRVDAEHATRFARQLVHRLHQLVDRGVPARGIEPVPAWGAARLRFADGTTLVVRGAAAGDVGVLASWARRGSIVPRSVSTAASRARLTFAAPDGHGEVAVLVRGLDQPD